VLVAVLVVSTAAMKLSLDSTLGAFLGRRTALPSRWGSP